MKSLSSFCLFQNGVFDFVKHVKSVPHDDDQFAIDRYIIPYLSGVNKNCSNKNNIHFIDLIPTLLKNDTQRISIMDRIAHSLKNTKEWKHENRIFAFISAGLSLKKTLGLKLCNLIRNRMNTVIFDVDPAIRMIRYNLDQHELYLRKVITVPFLIRRQLFNCNETVDHYRPFTAMFHGDTGRYDGGMRGSTRDILGFIPNSSYISTFNMRSNVSQLDIQMNQTIQQMLVTKLCLSPTGDNPLNRRTYEALAAGCVPIQIVSHSFQWAFGRSIDWNRIQYTLFPKDASLKQRHTIVNSVLKHREKEALRILSWANDSKLLNEMRHLGMRQACQFMNPYDNPGGMVSAMIKEIEYKF